MKNQDSKYNPFKDFGFVYVLYGIVIAIISYIVFLMKYGFVREVNMVMFSVVTLSVIWLFWIYHKRGQKGSFLLGFILGMFGGFVALMIPFLYIGNQQEDELMRMQDAMGEEIKMKLLSCVKTVKMDDYWSGPVTYPYASATDEEKVAMNRYSQAWTECMRK